jgi:hypothetical protein
MMPYKIELLTLLDKVLDLVSLPGNDFIFSSWSGVDEAAREIQRYRSEILQDDFTHLARLEVIFSPTGPLQELSLSNGWGTKFIDLAEKFDWVIKMGAGKTYPTQACKPDEL